MTGRAGGFGSGAASGASGRSGASGTPRERRPDVAWAAGVALLGGLFLWELLSLEWVPVARDMQMFFLPQRHLLWEAFQQQRLPLWTPFYGTGAPLMANFQSGVFYPPHWLFAVLPFFPAFNLLLVFHFVLGGAAAYAYARASGLSPAGGAMAGACFMLGGYFASLLNLLNALQAAAWVPALGYFLLRHAERGSLASFLGLIGTGLCGFLAGEPQTFVIGCGILGAHAILRLRSLPAGVPAARLTLARVGLAMLAVAGLAAIQLLPTAEMLAQSSRAAGLSYEEATAFAVDRLRLVHALFPPDYGDPVYSFGIKTQMGFGDPWLFSIYLGAIPLLIGGFAWSARPRTEAAFWAVAVVLGIALSLGDGFPLYRWMFEHVPGFAAFRFPEKFYLLAGLGVAMLAGRGLDALLRRPPGKRLHLLALGVLGAGLVAKLFWLVGREPFYAFARQRLPGQNFLRAYDFAWMVWGENLDVLLALLVGTVSALLLYRRGRLRPSLVAALLPILAAGDLFLAHRDLNPVVKAEFYERDPLIARYLPMDSLQTHYRYRATPFDKLSGIIRIQPGVALETQKWLWQHTMAPNTSQYRRVLAPDTWDAIKLQRYVDQHHIYRVLPDAERRWRLLVLTSVKFQYHRAWLEGGGYRAAARPDSMPGYLYEVEGTVPRAYMVPRASWHETDVEALNRALAPDFEPLGEVALVGEALEPATGSGSPARGSGRATSAGRDSPAASGANTARILEDSGETVRIGVVASAPGWLVLTDSYYPGWTAAVDGELREIRLANYFFRAIPIRPGDREVVFRYRSRPSERGRVVSAVTLGLLLVGLVVARHRSRAPGGRQHAIGSATRRGERS